MGLVLEPPPPPVDFQAQLREAGKKLLLPLACSSRCSFRRRTSFGWVLQPCGLCERGADQESPAPPFGLRAVAHVVQSGWGFVPLWGVRYLSAGPKPVPFVVFQQQAGESAATPAWAAKLLVLGTSMKSYTKRERRVGVVWPAVFDALAGDEQLQRALDAVLMLLPQVPSTSGLVWGVPDGAEAVVYDFLLEHLPDTIGAASAEGTKYMARRA